MKKEKQRKPYTCGDYREEMILAGLHRRLQYSDLNDEERAQLIKEIERLQKKMGLL